MTWGNVGAWAPGLFVAIIAPVQIWNLYRVRLGWRRRGAKAIEALLASRGEQLSALRNVTGWPAHAPHPGLSGAAVLFKVKALGADGAERDYDLAFDPLGGGALKRLAHGIWISPA